MNIDRYKYLRIQGRNLVVNTLTGKGVFGLCMELIRSKKMEQEDVDLYMEIDSWFAENLPWPEQCKRQESVVCYFKTENAGEMLKWTTSSSSLCLNPGPKTNKKFLLHPR